jgi:hypothetical protein
MNGTRSARNVSAAVVAGIAAWSSYSHMVHVALRFGERPEVAYVLPFSVDGMLVVSATAMMDDKRSGRRVRPAARVAFAAGVLASIAANIAAAEPTSGARIVAAWPALALLLVVEMLSRSGRAQRQSAAAGTGTTEQPAQVPTVRDAAAKVPAEQPEPPAEVPPTGSIGPRPPRSRQPAAVTRQLATEIITTEPGITRKEVAARVGVSTRRLREVLAADT